MSEASVGPGDSSDIEAAVSVWRESDNARRGGSPAPQGHEERARSHLENPDSFLIIAEDADGVVGVACAMPGLADDGAGRRWTGFATSG